MEPYNVWQMDSGSVVEVAAGHISAEEFHRVATAHSEHENDAPDQSDLQHQWLRFIDGGARVVIQSERPEEPKYHSEWLPVTCWWD